MFTLPDGKIIGKATDKEEYTAQLEDQLKRTAKQKRDVAAQCREEERCLCVLLGACIIALLTCPYMYIYIYIYILGGASFTRMRVRFNALGWSQ
jgi:hypothetical protein